MITNYAPKPGRPRAAAMITHYAQKPGRPRAAAMITHYAPKPGRPRAAAMITRYAQKPGRPRAAAVITKHLCTYTTFILRQDKRLRDHGQSDQIWRHTNTAGLSKHLAGASAAAWIWGGQMRPSRGGRLLCSRGR